MFLKGLQDKFKVKSGLKFLQEEMQRPAVAVEREKGITSIGCIVDVDNFGNAEVFYELIDDFSLRPNAIKIIGYKREYDKNSPYAIQIFSDRDLGWKGDIENGYVLEFLGREYDMLINYYQEDNLMMKLLSVKTPARLKVGFAAVDAKVNDLILDTSLSDFKLFKSELKKYLKSFKRIVMEQLMGTGVALVTPFKEDFSVDIGALERVVEHCIQGGVDYLVALGTTGESVTLSKSEKQLVTDVIVRANAGRLPLVLGVGGNNTAVVIEELNTLDLSEFVAILSVSPYYNKPTQEGIYQHFKAIAAVSPKPIILYNVPPRTGSNMLPETTIRLAHDIPNIVAIKEASADMFQIDQIIKGKPDDFMVISGEDFTALPTVLAGGAGVISVLGQGLPHAFSRMIQLGRDGNSDEAYEIHHALLPAMQLIFEEGNPAGIKSVFESLGLCSSVVRLPLVEATLGLKNRISSFLKSFDSVQV